MANIGIKSGIIAKRNLVKEWEDSISMPFWNGEKPMSKPPKKYLGTWVSSRGNLFHVEPSYGYCNIKFRIETIYQLFGISSDFIFSDHNWNRFDPKSFQESILERFNLKKLK